VLDADLKDGTPHLTLHTANPGNQGTNNLAVQPGTTDAIVRMSLDMGTATKSTTATEHLSESVAEVTWTGGEIDAGQYITHFSIWNHLSSGTALYISAVDTSKTTGSDGVVVSTGDLEVAIGVYAVAS
jgi:hypothetical protein